MELDKYLISFVVITVVFLTAMLMIGNLNSNYDDVDISTGDFSNVFNTSNELFDLEESMRGSVDDKSVDESNTESSMFSGGFKALKFIDGTFELAAKMLDAVRQTLGLPPFLFDAAMVALGLLVGMSLIYAVLRFQGR